MLRVRTALLAAAIFASTAGGALACDCPFPPNIRTHPELQAWRLGRAAHVAQGRIAEIWGGEHDGARTLLGKMIVSSVVKGNVPPDEITLVSTPTNSSCSDTFFLLQGFESGSDIAAELFKIPGDERKYTISVCAYLNLDPQGKRRR
jgi:hypothetical protein